MVHLAQLIRNRAKDIAELLALTKQVSGVFAVLKERKETTSYVNNILRLKLEHDLQCSLKTLKFGLCHGPFLEGIGSGVLVFGFGRASKQIRFFDRSDQMYKVDMKLGVATNTYCALGKIVEEKPYGQVTKDALESCLQNYVGKYDQYPAPFYYVPPLEGGTYPSNLSDLREPNEARRVVCYSAKCTNFKPPFVSIDIHCGAIFSACSFVDQVGKCLETGAHVVSLERTRMGPFSLSDAVPSYMWSWEGARAAVDRHRDAVDPVLEVLKKRHRRHKQRKNREERLREDDSYLSDDES